MLRDVALMKWRYINIFSLFQVFHKGAIVFNPKFFISKKKLKLKIFFKLLCLLRTFYICLTFLIGCVILE